MLLLLGYNLVKKSVSRHFPPVATPHARLFAPKKLLPCRRKRQLLSSSSIYPTLVASDTNDFVTPVNIEASSVSEFRNKFITEVYEKHNYRRISKTEACRATHALFQVAIF